MPSSLEDLTDQELIARAKDDPEMFGLLMDRYAEPLLRFIVRLTGWGTNEAEDILQETFIKTYRYLNSYDPGLKFSSWIYRIAYNQAIDALRHEQARPFMKSLPVEEVAHLLADQTDLEAEFLKQEAFEKLQTAIYALPLKYREVLVLRFLEEKDYDEITDILQKPKGTVATLIRRGRKLLFENIQQISA